MNSQVRNGAEKIEADSSRDVISRIENLIQFPAKLGPRPVLLEAKSKTETYREGDGGYGVVLDQPKADEGEELDEGEHVHPVERDVLEVHVVRLVLSRYEEQQDPIKELKTLRMKGFKNQDLSNQRS